MSEKSRTRPMSRTRAAAACFAAGLFAAAFRVWPVAAQAPAPAPYLNPDLDFESRARDLVSRMSVEEKVSQLTNQAAAIPRLGVPAYEWWNECLHGVARAGVATVFPQAIGLAATFDEPLMHEMAGVIADEARAKHHQFVRQGKRGRYQGLTFWSPNINIFRDPRWGRGQETYGEDPFLASRLGVAFVKGLQGDDPRYYKVIATAKHYAVHSGPEPDRHQLRRSPQRARSPRDVPPRVPRPGAGRRRWRPSWAPTTASTASRPRPASACSWTSCARSGASTGTWSRTAGPSTTSTCATSWWRRRKRRRRSGSRRAATSSAGAPTAPSERRSSAAFSGRRTWTWRSAGSCWRG